jgi:hypothetical protein
LYFHFSIAVTYGGQAVCELNPQAEGKKQISKGNFFDSLGYRVLERGPFALNIVDCRTVDVQSKTIEILLFDLQGRKLETALRIALSS